MTSLTTNTTAAAAAMANIPAIIQGMQQGYTSTQIATGGTPTTGGTHNNIALPTIGITSIPRFAAGGPITSPGLAMVDQGEWVLPAPIVSVLNALGSLGSSTTPSDPTSSSDRGTAMLGIQGQMLDLTTQRTTMEMTVINARNDQLTTEMSYLQMLNDTINKIGQLPGSSTTAGSLESMFSQVYATRGRQGGGAFRRVLP